jgi:pimeloyl-ACP methyl ester carboxylesterase
LLALTNHLARTSLQLNGYRSHRVGTTAGRVHVLDAAGRGHLPPVALLHGFSSCGAHYLPLLSRLRAQVRRLIAPDLPAHGFSDTPEVINSAVIKEGLIQAMDAVIDEPVVLFGNSLGGAAAVHYALARPEKVRGLILCSPTGAAMTGDELARFLANFDVDSHADALAFVDRLFARPNPLRHAFAWGVRRQFQNPDLKALLASLTPTDLLQPAQLAALRMPVLLMWGRAERILPQSNLDFFRRHLPEHARFEEPEHFGHSPYLDDAGAVARRILAFTAEVHRLPWRPSAARLSS